MVRVFKHEIREVAGQRLFIFSPFYHDILGIAQLGESGSRSRMALNSGVRSEHRIINFTFKKEKNRAQATASQKFRAESRRPLLPSSSKLQTKSHS
jgi:hypothetical protein